MVSLSDLFSVLFCLCWATGIFSDRIARHKIYSNLESSSFCFRRLNATHSIGCQSDESGNVGVLQIIQSDDHLDRILLHGNADPYVLAFHIHMFTTENLIKANKSDRVNGVLLLQLKSENRPDRGFSPDSTCPNDPFSLYTEKSFPKYAHCGNNPWNPNNPASRMMFMDLKFPVFLIQDKENLDNLHECYENFNKKAEWPFCAVQLTARMSAARDTPTCMSRNRVYAQYCDPISSYNIFSTFKPLTASKSPERRSVIVVAARLDSFSLFFNNDLGANSVLTTVIALLSIAKTLATHRNQSSSEKNVLFALFNGETWDYIGSSRTVFDLRENRFSPLQYFTGAYEIPELSLHHISHFIELQQLSVNIDNDFVIHTDYVASSNSKEKDELGNVLLSAAQKAKFNAYKSTREDGTIPPSSLQKFLQHDANITGVVIAGFDKKYKNKYYNSFLDDGRDIHLDGTVDKLKRISTAISRALFTLMGVQPRDDVMAEVEPIEEMVECFIKNSSCPLFVRIANTRSNGEPFKTYTSVSGFTRGEPRNTFTPYVYLVGKLLAYYSGDIVKGSSKVHCLQELPKSNKNYVYEWLPYINKFNNESCLQTTRFFTEALSPAFVSDSENFRSTDYSTWTESVWTGSSARIFLKPSRSQEVWTLLLGVFVTISAFAIVVVFDRKQSVLLNSIAKSTESSPVGNSSNHVTRGVQQYNVRGDEITFAGPNRNEAVVTTQL